MSQDWARLLYVGDILFNLKKITVLAEDDEVPDKVKEIGKRVAAIEIEFRLSNNAHIYFWYYDTELERDEDFDEIDEETLISLLMKEIE